MDSPYIKGIRLTFISKEVTLMKKSYMQPDLEVKQLVAAETFLSSTVSGDDNTFGDDIWQD